MTSYQHFVDNCSLKMDNSWGVTGLDERLLRAVKFRMGLVRPTLVQVHCCQLAISSGRDLLVRGTFARCVAAQRFKYLSLCYSVLAMLISINLLLCSSCQKQRKPEVER